MPHSARVSTRADASHAQVVPAERADSQQDQHDRIDTDAAISDYSDTADAGAQRSLLDLRTALGATWSSQWNSVDGLMSAMLNTDDEGRQRIMALFTAYTDEVKNNEGAMPPPSDSEHGSSTSPASTTAPRSDSGSGDDSALHHHIRLDETTAADGVEPSPVRKPSAEPASWTPTRNRRQGAKSKPSNTTSRCPTSTIHLLARALQSD